MRDTGPGETHGPEEGAAARSPVIHAEGTPGLHTRPMAASRLALGRDHGRLERPLAGTAGPLEAGSSDPCAGGSSGSTAVAEGSAALGSTTAMSDPSSSPHGRHREIAGPGADRLQSPSRPGIGAASATGEPRDEARSGAARRARFTPRALDVGAAAAVGRLPSLRPGDVRASTPREGRSASRLTEAGARPPATNGAVMVR